MAKAHAFLGRVSVLFAVAFDICILLNINIREDGVKEQCLATGCSKVSGNLLNFQSSFQCEINPEESYPFHRGEISSSHRVLHFSEKCSEQQIPSESFYIFWTRQ